MVVNGKERKKLIEEYYKIKEIEKELVGYLNVRCEEYNGCSSDLYKEKEFSQKKDRCDKIKERMKKIRILLTGCDWDENFFP
jgi:hypothetical protein